MATKGRQRRKERRAERRENRNIRKRGPNKAVYGGSEERLKTLRGNSDEDLDRAQSDYRVDNQATRDELANARSQEQGAFGDYKGYESTAKGSRAGYESGISSIGDAAGRGAATRNTAFESNRLAGTADNVLARRAAELAGAPTIGQATDTAIGANNAAAQARLGQSLGLANRQARGLAGSMGEGGALAMQQAMANAGAGAADALAMNNTEQSQLAADMRLQAALRQNELDVNSANLGLSTRMGAAEQDRAAQLAIAEANAAGDYDSALQMQQARGGLMQNDVNNMGNASGRQLNLLGARADLATGRQGMAQNAEQIVRQGQQAIEGAQLGADSAYNAAKYAAAQENSPFSKLKKVVSGHDMIKGTAPAANLFGFGNK